MSASVNKVILIGHLGGAPELRYMPDGTAIATLSMATTETWKDSNGVRQEKTQWHRVVFYRRLAEVVMEYLSKGDPLFVEGRISTRKWTGKDGTEQYMTEIIAGHMQLMGTKRDNGSHPGTSQPASTRKATTQKSSASRPVMPPPSGTGFDDMPDDIPY
jgi:single-strand DNA-binding protein